MGYPQQGPGSGDEDWGGYQAPYGPAGQEGQQGYDPDYGLPPRRQPGHYPDDHGMAPYPGGYSPYPQGRYGPQQGGSDDQTMALLSHLSGLLLGFVGPLIFYLIKKDDSPYVRHHAAEALNFQLTVLIASVVSAVLMLLLIGILLMMVVGIAALVFTVLAALAANRGEWYRYPINIRMVN